MRFVLLEVMSKNPWPAYRKAHVAHERANPRWTIVLRKASALESKFLADEQIVGGGKFGTGAAAYDAKDQPSIFASSSSEMSKSA